MVKEVEDVVTVALFALLNVGDILNNQVVAVLDLHALPSALRSAKDILNNQVAAVLVLHVQLNVLQIVVTNVVAVVKPTVLAVVE